MLQSNNLSLAYTQEIIVKALSLDIPTGKITALVGANGCGKSTLLKGLSRLLKPHSGAVYLDGKAIHQIPTKQLAQQIGVLPQSPVTPEGLTVRELVAQGRYPHQSWFQQWSAEDEQLTEEAMTITKIAEFADRPLDMLSGGQRQRAWIAMALAQQTQTLLLDEPTTFLDVAYQIEVLDLLAELNQRGRTIIMVLHDLNLACRYAHNLVAIREGQLHAQGEPAIIMTEQLVEAVFQLKSCIVPDPVFNTPMCIPISRVEMPDVKSYAKL